MLNFVLFVRQHIELSGIFSITSITIGIVLQSILGIIGGIVGLITIYTFLEKKGLLPKWMILKNKENKTTDIDKK